MKSRGGLLWSGDWCMWRFLSSRISSAALWFILMFEFISIPAGAFAQLHGLLEECKQEMIQSIRGATIAGDSSRPDFKHADLHASQSESLEHPNILTLAQTQHEAFLLSGLCDGLPVRLPSVASPDPRPALMHEWLRSMLAWATRNPHSQPKRGGHAWLNTQENKQDGIRMSSHQPPSLKSWNLFMVVNNERSYWVQHFPFCLPFFLFLVKVQKYLFNPF